MYAEVESLLSVTQFSRLHLEATSSLHCHPHSLVLDEVYVIDKRRPTAATGYTLGGYCIRGRGEAKASNTITAECISRSRGRPPFIWLVLLHMAADQEKHIEPPYSIPASACNAAQTYGFCCQLCPARTV